MRGRILFITLMAAALVMATLEGCTSEPTGGVNPGADLTPGATPATPKPDLDPAASNTTPDVKSGSTSAAVNPDSPGPGDLKTPGTNAGGTPASGSTGEPAAPKIPAETYWEIQLERLRVTKENYEQSLAIYEKYKGDTPEAKAEIKEVRRQAQEKMRDIFNSKNVNPRDFYPRGPEAREVNQSYQQYRKDHPEVEEQYKKLMEEIRDLREKTWTVTGRERPGRGGPDGPGGPGGDMMRGPGEGPRSPRTPPPMPPRTDTPRADPGAAPDAPSPEPPPVKAPVEPPPAMEQGSTAP